VGRRWNVAKQIDILALMREAGFLTVFVRIETPEPEVLTGIDKAHNASLPMFEAIETLHARDSRRTCLSTPLGHRDVVRSIAQLFSSLKKAAITRVILAH
jgi:hypothetical protein